MKHLINNFLIYYKILLALFSFSVFCKEISKQTIQEIPGLDLLNYFNSTCPSQREWSKLAIADSTALIQILENIKNDVNCKTMSGLISQLGNLQTQVRSLENFSSITMQIEQLNAKETELYFQLSSTQDVGVQSLINETIRSIQLDKAGLISQNTFIKEINNENIKNIYSQLVNTTQGLFTSISNNQKCLNNNPNLITSVTSLATSVASAATVFNPALSYGLGAATDFLGKTVEALRQGKYNRQIRKISDSSVALEGYKCVMESLSNRWCDMQLAKDILHLKINQRREKTETGGFKSVIKFFDRELPVLLEWLNNVRSGVAPSTTADAGRQSRVFAREALVRSSEAIGNGTFNEKKPLYDSFQNPKDKYSILRNIIESLTNKYCSGSSFSSDSGTSNPMFDIHNKEYAPYYLLGLSKIPENSSGAGPIDFCIFDPFDDKQWPEGKYSPNFETVKTNFKNWIAQARKRVNQESTLLLQPDALQILTLSYESTSNKWKYSAVNSIKNIIEFLNNYKPANFENTPYNKIYLDTIKRLQEIEKTILSAVISDQYKDPKEALEIIFTQADLQYGTIVFQSRLELIIRISLNEYLKNFNPEEVNFASMLLASDSYLDVLLRISGTEDLTMMAADIEQNAEPIAMNNLMAFSEVFAKNLNKILKNLNEKINSSKDSSITKVHQKSRSRICLLISTLPKWPSDIDQNYCLNTQLDALVINGPTAPMLTSNYINQNFDQRVCSFQNYLRRSKIYLDWGIKI